MALPSVLKYFAVAVDLKTTIRNSQQDCAKNYRNRKEVHKMAKTVGYSKGR